MACSFWKRTVAALLAGAGLTLSASAGDRELILRQAGKPDRICLIEGSEPLANGAVKLRLRDKATGHVMSVIDRRGASPVTQTAHQSRKMPTAPSVQRDDPLFPKDAGVAMPKSPTPPAEKPGLLRRVFSSSSEKRPPAPPTPKTPNVYGLEVHMVALKDALRPSIRESAALAMTRSPDFNPGVAAALLETAQVDPAPTVRACCVRCLSARGFDDPSYRAALGVLKGDESPIVQAEAARAMGKLGLK